MEKIPFIVSARTAKLIWQENFANANWAIVELVKNSYDADAKNVVIIFLNHSLYIIDNGDWMNRKKIEDNWMKIWTDNKFINFESNWKRIKSWAKWIWRFALDRLWSLAEMYTVDKTENKWLYWKVNWSDFDTGDSISNIWAELDDNIPNFTLQKFLSQEFEGFELVKSYINNLKINSWTIIKISNLRDKWELSEIDSLYENLEILVPPTQSVLFSISLFSDVKNAKYWEVNTADYDEYDYKVVVNYLWNDQMDIELEVYRNELDVEKLEKDYLGLFDIDKMWQFPYDLATMKQGFYKTKISLLDKYKDIDKDLLNHIWKFNFEYFFIKNRISDDDEDSKKYPYLNINKAIRSNWLDKFWWIKIYRDWFRIRPYWENGDDWLRLWDRQAKSPAWAWQRLWWYKIRPNQVSGVINISRVFNDSFNDKSWREWIQENAEFALFKNIILDLIRIFETDRNTIMYNLSELYKKNNEREKTKEFAKEIKTKFISKNTFENRKSNNVDELVSSENIRWLIEATDVLEEEVKEKDEEIKMLRWLASVWLMVSSFSHELWNIELSLDSRAKWLRKILVKFLPIEQCENLTDFENPYYRIDLIEKEDFKIQQWLKYSINGIKRDKRERVTINISEYFQKFYDTWSSILDEKNIELQILSSSDHDIKIKAFEVDLDTIFNNLLSNSIKAFKLWEKSNIIKIQWSYDEDFIHIEFNDNGVWLPEEYKKDPDVIFNAFESSRKDKNGKVIWTWLWMYLVKTVINDYNKSKIKITEINDWFWVKISFYINKNI